MDGLPVEQGRFVIPGIGPAADPAERVVHEVRGPAPGLPPEAVRALEADLRAAIEGEVRFDSTTRGAYSTDGSNYRQVPIGVVVPRSPGDVAAALAACRRHGAPVLGRGGGTSLAGQCCNVGVVFDFSKYMHRILEIDPERKLARVEPGVVLDTLRARAEEHHLTFGPDPATHMNCTLGGMIGNNSCGIHAMMAGRTADNVRRLEVITYDGERMWVGPTGEAEIDLAVRGGGRRGEILGSLRALRDRHADEIRRRYPHIPRRVSGYNLDELLPEKGFQLARALVGTESTCVLVLQAELDLVHSPPHRVLVVLGYEDVYQAGDDVPRVREFGPIGLEGVDSGLVDDMEKKGVRTRNLELYPEGDSYLLVEFGGETAEEAEAAALRCVGGLQRGRGPSPSAKVFADPEKMELVWKVRESGLSATARVPGQPDHWPGWEDSAVPPERVGEYLRKLRALLDQYGYHCSLYGHFGQGCIHTRIDFDLGSAAGIARYRDFMGKATDLVVDMGGSLSGEHGDGQARAEFLPKMFGERLVDAFREFKRLWDPEGRMNPGKVVDPYPIDENLRFGAGYEELRPRTHFKLLEDDGSWGRAATRCVGVGKCRRPSVGVMCPSFMVTRDEVHATRGRARLLFESLLGDPVKGGWRSEEVREALDLCLACKGCKSDCPMNVDMATYKAEFLAHYYEGRLRPRSAYAMGLVMWWARLAALAPRLANLVARGPGLSRLAKAAGGIAPSRELPAFAPYTFRRWFASHRPRHPGGARVMLYTDTFNDFFHPETAIAAVEVLERSGYRVEIPRRRVCCGRPLYDYGMLDLAARMLRRNLRVLRPVIEEGVPLIVLEPSCGAVFKDELPNLLGDEGDAAKLKQRTRFLAEFILEAGDAFTLPRVERPALVQAHCHQHALGGVSPEKEVMSRLGLDHQVLDSGCCGMAGSFGFEEGAKHEVSMAAGERVILPAVRAAPAEALVLADGFSCRTQIAQEAGRRALHLAEAIQLGYAREARAVEEGRLPSLPLRAHLKRGVPLAAAAVAAAGVLAWRAARGARTRNGLRRGWGRQRQGGRR